MQEKDKTTSSILTNLPDTNILGQLLETAQQEGYGFALWRLPNSSHTQVVLSYSVDVFNLEMFFEELPSGFIFHPFDNTKPGLFLKSDLLFRFKEEKLHHAESPIAAQSKTWYEEYARNRKPKKTNPFQPNVPSQKNKNDFENLVLQCLDQIHKNNFEKIVPSRFKVVDLPGSFDSIEAFRKLCTAYAYAMISLVYTPQHGSWLGATPETLVSIEGKSTFRTVAMAGTQPFKPGVNLRNVAWTQKEIEEQALVSRYIINCFKKIRLREFEEHGPKTVVAGNLMHLKTDFSVDMLATNFPQLGSVMLRLLHPTSAVCGMPLENAMKFLRNYEDYDRSFYAGFLGPINFENESHLFVNLRCMQVLQNKAIAYAGAGVTIDSIPENEWEETEIKMNTLLEVIL